jgi:hypothetical protein
VLDDDFETPRGSAVPHAQIHVENKGDSIAVTEETAASGKRSLKVIDNTGLQWAFNPHFYYTPRHVQGVTKMRFDLRVGPGVVFHHEWRDDSNPYRVGPSLWVRDGKLIAAGRELMKFPENRWVRIAVAAGLGAQSPGTWDLTVTMPGLPAGSAVTQYGGLPNGSPDWKKLDWLGFCSLGTEKATFYLDNLTLSTSFGE